MRSRGAYSRRKVDGNQAQIVNRLREEYNCEVWITSALGKGAPDFVVAANGRNWAFECKDPKQPKSKQELTPTELAWHTAWRKAGGQVTVVRTYYDVLSVISGTSRYPQPELKRQNYLNPLCEGRPITEGFAPVRPPAPFKPLDDEKLRKATNGPVKR